MTTRCNEPGLGVAVAIVGSRAPGLYGMSSRHSTRTMQFPESQTYRPALAVAFLVCFVWVAVLAFGLLERLPFPEEAKGLLALCVPLVASVIILYRTTLFQELQQTRRFVNLCGVAIALLACSFVLLLAVMILLFILGGI